MTIKKRGRPRVYKPKTNIKKVRISDEWQSKLDYICEKRGLSEADVFREGLSMMYRDALNRPFLDDF